MNNMNDAMSEAIEHPVTEPRTRPKAEHREGRVARNRPPKYLPMLFYGLPWVRSEPR